MGEKHVEMRTQEGAQCLIRMQATSVRKSLMRVGEVNDEGHRIVFEQGSGCTEHLTTGQRTRFERQGGVCALHVDVEPVFSTERERTRCCRGPSRKPVGE